MHEYSLLGGNKVNPSFGTYQLAEEHEALREAVRSLAEKEIKPYAAEVDENERFPVEAHNALVKSGFAASRVALRSSSAPRDQR